MFKLIFMLFSFWALKLKKKPLFNNQIFFDVFHFSNYPFYIDLHSAD